MLVLSRGPTDKIVFPNLDITVEILRIGRNRVRVGIDAPKDVRVLRHELADEQSGTGVSTRTWRPSSPRARRRERSGGRRRSRSRLATNCRAS